MAMTLAAMMLGTHAFFFRDGTAYTVPGAGTAARESKPGATDPAWIDMGVVAESSDSLEDTEIEIYKPAPGRLRLYDVLSTKDKLTVKFTTEEFGPFSVEALYRTLALTSASTQFNPLEGIPKKGWLKLQRYDQDDNLRVVLDLFVRLKIAGEVSMGGADLVKPQFECMVLHSTLNTGTL
jgi:hypothetical protein